MEFLSAFNFAIWIFFIVCYSYQMLYIAVPFLKKDKPHKETKMHKFAVLISARNESAVIANLLESIKGQTYPEELVDIFLVADNCTDNTAEIARNCGANVYERFDKINVGKGYAMNFMLNNIKEEYGEDCYDGYFVFDADNVLDPNYIAEMNKSFSDGHEILTGYRNSKNYGDNWVSAGYALWFLRETMYLNYSRALLGTSCAISGTGFMFSKKILKNIGNWNYFLLTEDIEFTADQIASGYKVGFCKDAVLFDEQPNKFSQSVRQRMRWAKGYVQVFCNYGARLLKGMIKNSSFSCFDMMMNIPPALFMTMSSIAVNGTAFIVGLILGLDVTPIIRDVFMSIGGMYFTMFVIGAITTATEWNNIYTTTKKKIVYLFTFPVFMLTYIPISIMALFKKVEWKPIVHTKSKSLADIKNVN